MLRQYDLCQGDFPCLREHTVLHYPEEQFLCAKALAKLFYTELQSHNVSEECYYLVSMDTMCKVQGIFDITQEGRSLCKMNIKNIVTRALLCGAVVVIILHGCPSGELSQSQLDVSGTKKLKKGLASLGIILLDHIIIDTNSCGYFSFKEHKLGNLV